MDGVAKEATEKEEKTETLESKEGDKVEGEAMEVADSWDQEEVKDAWDESADDEEEDEEGKKVVVISCDIDFHEVDLLYCDFLSTPPLVMFLYYTYFSSSYI